MHSGAELSMIERVSGQLQVALARIIQLEEELEARDLQDKADDAEQDYYDDIREARVSEYD